MFGVMLVAMVTMGLAVVIGQDFFSARLMERGTSAFLVADGAMEYAISRIKQDPKLLAAPPADIRGGQIGGGTYRITINHVGISMYRVESVGTVHEVQRTVISFLYVQDPYAGFRKAILSHHDLLMTGSGECYGGTHANQSTELGGSVDVSGDVDSVRTTTVTGGGVNILNGTARSGRSPLIFPTLDFAHYYNIARENNMVYTGNYGLNGNYAPPGGVLWIDGNLTVTGKTWFKGCIIVTGTFRQNGGFVHEPVGTMPAIASREGNIEFYGGTAGAPVKILGLVYAKSGLITLHGNSPIRGNVMGWGGVTCHGNWGVVDLVEQKPEIEEDVVVEVVSWES
jgi:hypothetical protein